MNLELLTYLLGTIVILLGILYIYGYYKKLPPIVTQEYKHANGNFKVKGRMNEFIIQKNNHLEYLVKDGNIVAMRDTNIGKDFVYYKEQ